MATINLLRKSTVFNKDLNSYRMILEVVSSEDITTKVFVNQRLRTAGKYTFDDVFVAVATPAQIEDLDEDSPNQYTSFYRTDTIDLVSRNADYINEVFDTIVSDLQKLVADTESLNILEADGLYTIQSTQIDVNMDIQHTHYRLPMTAQPCGLNTITTDGNGNQIQSVGSQDASLRGWLNTTGTDPVGYAFKYNIATDTSLSSLWPPDSTKIGYAHMEVNGITTGEVLFNSNGIFWRDNALGKAPWPQDWQSTSNPGSAQYQITLLIDLIV